MAIVRADGPDKLRMRFDEAAYFLNQLYLDRKKLGKSYAYNFHAYLYSATALLHQVRKIHIKSYRSFEDSHPRFKVAFRLRDIDFHADIIEVVLRYGIHAHPGALTTLDGHTETAISGTAEFVLGYEIHASSVHMLELPAELAQLAGATEVYDFCSKLLLDVHELIESFQINGKVADFLGDEETQALLAREKRWQAIKNAWKKAD